ncbi:GTP cyclohydrolase I FolE [Chrysiogenes arsenatis]|uniref:GTP cyclohydrolase I FolE n=1 Tax=Chrysiogenes arsenatis TaxID=309797 RepID=UPI0004220F63|nr:GTP cyclohydrolase I FolE [Chrysiogenes arsenatis]
MLEHTQLTVPELSISQAVSHILREIGEDETREGLEKTPQRVEKMYQELMSGYTTNIDDIVNGAIFDCRDDDMVLVKEISFSSMCEHHMLPFLGKVHVAYIPDGKIIGLSKIPRIVEMFAKRLQVQERLTSQIAKALYDHLKPQGVAVMVEAIHLCAIIRGVRNHSTSMVTTSLLGAFRNDKLLRSEFMEQTAKSATTSITW